MVKLKVLPISDEDKALGVLCELPLCEPRRVATHVAKTSMEDKGLKICRAHYYDLVIVMQALDEITQKHADLKADVAEIRSRLEPGGFIT